MHLDIVRRTQDAGRRERTAARSRSPDTREGRNRMTAKTATPIAPDSPDLGTEDSEDQDLTAPEALVGELDLSDWQMGYWPSSKNITQ